MIKNTKDVKLHRIAGSQLGWLCRLHLSTVGSVEVPRLRPKFIAAWARNVQPLQDVTPRSPRRHLGKAPSPAQAWLQDKW